MAKATCVRAFGKYEVGDEVEVPDGAEVSPYYFELVETKSNKKDSNDESGDSENN